jgi:YidC/Oxa1 family membrane protein insertase
MDERRFFLAVALSFLVLTVFSLARQPAQREQRGAPSPSAQPTAAAAPTATPAPEKPVATIAEASAADSEERRIEVSTPHALVAFTNRGARLLSWRLPRFLDARGRPEETVALVPRGAQVDADNAARPLDVATGDRQLDELLRTQALFRASSESISLSGRQEATLVFEWAASGVVARKELLFRADWPVVDVTVSVQRGGQEIEKRLLWGPGLGVPTAEERSLRGYQPAQAVALQGRKVERIPAKKMREAIRTFQGVRWAGVESRYFAALFIPPATAPMAVEASAADVPMETPGEFETRTTAALVLGQATGPVGLYVGPKDYFSLSRLGQDLKAIVPVGDWIGPIVVPLMSLLQRVQSHLGNYGWSIVLLTVLINLVMAPFRHFGIVNGIKMARMAPEMRVIQERYKKLPLIDRQAAMQGEMQALYARHGIGMSAQFVGCLPMLITMPFFFAFYRVLDVLIELRGAPFLWMPDLSQKDPLYLAPILMAVSMFAMQKMTPSGADPTQQRMMLLMPLVFVSFLFWAPAGLNVYWLASNLCAMVQQGLTMAIVAKKPREAAPKPKRR